MSVIDAADRFAARRHRAQHERWRHLKALFRQCPEAVVMAVLMAFRDNSEEPLRRLPSPWRERTIAAMRRECAS